VLCGPHAVETLEALRRDRFVGLSIYLFDPSVASSLALIPDEAVARLVEWNWLVSVNSRGESWRGWLPLLDRFGGLRILVSHLGLPEAVASPPSAAVASKALAPVLELAAFPGPRVKLSGFYAATIPGSEYPHRAAWPYVEALVDSFGPGRLLWGSDFSPVLDSLTFPQTYGLFAGMPFLSDRDRRRIEGGNLIDLLDEVVTG
jgi:L-fuconolactonase